MSRTLDARWVTISGPTASIAIATCYRPSCAITTSKDYRAGNSSPRNCSRPKPSKHSEFEGPEVSIRFREKTRNIMAAYLVANIEVSDPTAFEEYRKRVPATIAAHG